MRWKESKLYSILNFKCPSCHEGDMFEGSTWFNYRTFSHMKEKCPCCQQPFEPEPGFYYGAMFISYGFSTAMFIAVWVVLSFLVERVSLTMMLAALVVIVVGLLPVTLRLSRSIWLNIFVKYKGPCKA